jgi:hypothetical protein
VVPWRVSATRDADAPRFIDLTLIMHLRLTRSTFPTPGVPAMSRDHERAVYNNLTRNVERGNGSS